ncbi:hypothetical protein HPB47_025383 [Ixodes persulcatus]|uniref:Uncharacterized protein n=1 Tax=Ixodes persulcatus TaxID=34615 RepID=A0AC60Q1V4_IXOPE|nr:hypothetical protein HPB47_025383 [Ixodes persulcatus]
MKKKNKGSWHLVRKLSGRSFSDLTHRLNIGDPELGSRAMTSQEEHDLLSVSTMNIKLPPFWTSDPGLCFIQVESQFAARRVTADLTKYHHVVSSLPTATACEIQDLLFAPPAEDAYKTLKETLIRRLTPSEPQRFQKLLRETELGDCRPSQLLRQMQQLFGTRTTDLDSIMLRELFLQRLPTNVRKVLISAGETNLSKLAELAGRLMTVPSSSVSVAQAEPATSDHSGTAAVGFPPVEPEYQSATPQQQKVCWYHRKYGNAARNCVPSCEPSSVNGRGRH